MSEDLKDIFITNQIDTMFQQKAQQCSQNLVNAFSCQESKLVIDIEHVLVTQMNMNEETYFTIQQSKDKYAAEMIVIELDENDDCDGTC